MPAYVAPPSNVSPIALQKGESVYVVGTLAAGATQLPLSDNNVADEAAPAGASIPSIAVNLQPGFEGMPAPMVCVEIAFPSAPGASEQIEIQEADTDIDLAYITPSAAAYTVTTFTNNRARVDLSPTGGKFMRVKRTKGANAVGCRVKITRLA